MPPPDLPRDAPVFDISHPSEVGIAPSFGNDSNPPLSHGPHRRLRQRFDIDKPLRGQVRLDHRLAAIAMPDRMPMRLDFFQIALLFQLSDDKLSGLESFFRIVALNPLALFASSLTRSTIDPGIVVIGADPVHLVTLADF